MRDWYVDHTNRESIEALVESLLEWCKAQLASCRRPYGIDHFDLIIACRAGESAVQSQAHSRLRPLSLYGEDLLRTLRERLHTIANGHSEPLWLSAGFFSWGDATAAALGTNR